MPAAGRIEDASAAGPRRISERLGALYHVHTMQRKKQRENTDVRFDAQAAAAIDFSGVRFEDCQFDRCDLQKREIRSSKFVDCVFDTCDMVVADVTDTSFVRVRFRSCRLSGINWSVAREWDSVTFEDCQLNDGSFLGLPLDGCEFVRCAARGVSFREVSLVKAVFCESDLSGAEFVKCDLRGADFRGATGYAIDVRENQVQKARFSLPEAASLLRGLGIVLD